MGRKASQGEKELLAAALDNREFCVWYQPQVDMETGKIVGAEALVRWQRPGKGLILPGRFIPALEENGLMPLLDCEVLRIVCRDIREAREGEIDPGWVSVNLSQLHAGHYSGEMVGRRAREAVARDRLRFELTETAPRPEGSGEMLDFARRLQEQGFQIAMDDYGTGNSTLKLLHQIPFDILKLDRYFVSRIGAKKSETILKSTISLAKSLGMKVVAEGVETREQMEFLLEHGCRLGQGYYFSRPLEKETYFACQKEGRNLPFQAREPGKGEV